MTTREPVLPRGTIRADLLEVLASGDPPAFAVDEGHHVVFWNRGAERLLGRSAQEALGRRCHEILAGRDVFGNRYCYVDCPVLSTLRRRESVNSFELDVPTGAASKAVVNVTVVPLPGSRPELFTAVHLLQPVDEASRLARLLSRLEWPALPSGAPRLGRTNGGEAVAQPPLTDREKEILGWIAAGLQNKEIAKELGISLATVRNHVHNILEKLEVHSKLEAVSLAFRNGWTGTGASGTGRVLADSLRLVPARNA